MMPPDGLDGVFGQLDQLVSVSIFEFVRECSGQSPVEAQAEHYRPVIRMSHDSASLSAMRRLERMTRTKSSNLSLSAASTRRPRLVSR